MAKITRRGALSTLAAAALAPSVAQAAEHPDHDLLVIGVEFERRWSIERGTYEAARGDFSIESDDRCNAAADNTKEIVEVMAGMSAKTVDGYRLLARAYIWCRGENPDEPMGLEPYGSNVTTDQKVRARLINSLLGHI